ncbi:MAG: transcriptional repressor [Acholeplasmataceae bacterium]|nr:transcriptional repressor [Acholeplasmataceae bacterium]
MRMTKQRKDILTVLKKSTMPMSADMILQATGNKSMNLSTVYRTLDTFSDEGLISRSTLDNTGYYHLNREHHCHYMICLKCHKMFEIDCHIDLFENNIHDHHDFLVTHHEMTVYGYCSDCRSDMHI